jgi:hypothetical protein
MINDLVDPSQPVLKDYPRMDSRLSFTKYIADCKAMIEQRRTDLNQYDLSPSHLIEANAPFECVPKVAMAS